MQIQFFPIKRINSAYCFSSADSVFGVLLENKEITNGKGPCINNANYESRSSPKVILKLNNPVYDFWEETRCFAFQMVIEKKLSASQ